MSSLLKLFSSGPDVSALQQALLAAGFSPGAIDGSFGPATHAAMLAFQQSKGLEADGILGPKTATALGLAPVPSVPSAIPSVTVDIVSKLFPATPVANIRANLPPVLAELAAANLSDKAMVLMALGTIRAETESFLPISEGQSRFNTSKGGHPFDLYDNRADLGNTGAPDGANFRGRGFVQLTGRANYTKYSGEINVDLIANPDRANDPQIAARLLARFLGDKEDRIRKALAAQPPHFRAARKLVNGGSLGIKPFTDVIIRGLALIPDPS